MSTTKNKRVNTKNKGKTSSVGERKRGPISSDAGERKRGPISSDAGDRKRGPISSDAGDRKRGPVSSDAGERRRPISSDAGDRKRGPISSDARDRRRGRTSFHADDHKRDVATDLPVVQGKVQAHPKGFGFLLGENGQEDIFLPPNSLNGAMNGDVVKVQITSGDTKKHPFVSDDKKQKTEGRVIEVLEHANERIVGTYEKPNPQVKFGFVAADEKRLFEDIYIAQGDDMKAKTGDRVVVEIRNWGSQQKGPSGKIVEIFADAGSKGLDSLVAIKKNQYEVEFSPEVLAQAKKLAVIKKTDYEGREDFRSWFLVTIDGLDARDLDDAVSLTKEPNGNYLLGVHIADVSHYVPANTLLDKEAWERATSVYFPDLVLPMLPQVLSNDVCSLNAGVDRLAMSCLMEIDSEGQVVEHKICQSVIHVGRRLSYERINAAMMQNDTEALAELKEIIPLLQQLNELREILRRARFKNGSIDFDFPETKVIMDEEGHVVDIRKRETGIAEQMIEEMMVIANKTVATEYHEKEAPFLYRVHEAFGEEKLQEINVFLARWGYMIQSDAKGKVTPASVQKVLLGTKGKPEEMIVSTMLLRAMSHARYANQALGHFALAMPYYSHFTSPIRRYPDLAIHRVIKAYLVKGKLAENTVDKWRADLGETAEQSSLRERMAEDAEREVVKVKCCQYMLQHIGESFAGRISGVTGHGFYVGLENTVEGMVSVANLTDDYYEFVENDLTLIGKSHHKRYQLGDEVMITVKNVNLEDKTIDFVVAENNLIETKTKDEVKKVKRNKKTS